MAVFNEINAQGKAAGLPELSHRYNSDGIVYRRESDGSVVFVTFS